MVRLTNFMFSFAKIFLAMATPPSIFSRAFKGSNSCTIDHLFPLLLVSPTPPPSISFSSIGSYDSPSFLPSFSSIPIKRLSFFPSLLPLILIICS
jgi:hypothetical protein